MRWMLTVFLYTGLLVAPTVVRSERQLTPSFDVAYRERHEGKLSESIRLLHLGCYLDGPGSLQCSLTTITLNQCMDLPGGKGFFPKAERTDTVEGSLRIVARDTDYIALEEKIETTTLTYRFGFAPRQGMRPLGTLLTNYNLTAFRGSATKLSAMTGTVLSWEMVPLEGSYSHVPLLC